MPFALFEACFEILRRCNQVEGLLDAPEKEEAPQTPQAPDSDRNFDMGSNNSNNRNSSNSNKSVVESRTIRGVIRGVASGCMLVVISEVSGT